MFSVAHSRSRLRQVCRLLVLEDLQVVKKLCVVCFPPQYDILNTYVKMYHTALSKHVSSPEALTQASGAGPPHNPDPALCVGFLKTPPRVMQSIFLTETGDPSTSTRDSFLLFPVLYSRTYLLQLRY